MKVNGQVLEQVSKFKYLGQWITEDGKCDLEVKCRIEIAKSTFTKMRDVLCSRSLDVGLRKRLIRCYVLSTFLYASETWTLNKDLESRINAFELWIYRRMLRVSYADRITNVRIFEMVKDKPRLLIDVIERKLKYFGHLIRADGKQKELLEGKVEGTRSRGKQRYTWARDIRVWCNKSYADCSRTATDRVRWRAMVADLTREMAPR